MTKAVIEMTMRSIKAMKLMTRNVENNMRSTEWKDKSRDHTRLFVLEFLDKNSKLSECVGSIAGIPSFLANNTSIFTSIPRKQASSEEVSELSPETLGGISP